MLYSLLKVHLELKGFKVFLDIEKLTAGRFDNKLLDSIKQAKHFILVLTDGALEKCRNDDFNKDWVHRVSTQLLHVWYRVRMLSIYLISIENFEPESTKSQKVKRRTHVWAALLYDITPMKWNFRAVSLYEVYALMILFHCCFTVRYFLRYFCCMYCRLYFLIGAACSNASLCIASFLDKSAHYIRPPTRTYYLIATESTVHVLANVLLCTELVL